MIKLKRTELKMKTLVKKALVFSVFLFSISTGLFAKERIVVTIFEDKSGRGLIYSEKLNAIVEEELIKTEDFEVVNRTELSKLLDEQKLSLSGIINDKQAADFGKIAGAKKAVVGRINSINYGFGVCEISAEIKFIDVETAVLYRGFNIKEKVRGLNEEKAIYNSIEKVGKRFYAEYKGGDIKTKFEKLSAKEDLDNSMYLSVNGVFSGISIKDFNRDADNVYIHQNETTSGVGFGLEFGKNIDNLFIFSNGKIYTTSPINIFKVGVGGGYNTFDSEQFYIKTGGELNLAFANGQLGKLTSTLLIGGKTFAEGSDIIVSKMFVGIKPFIKAGYKFTDKISLFGNVGYNIYGDTNGNLTVKDKFGGETGNPDVKAGKIDMNGIEVSSGIEILF